MSSVVTVVINETNHSNGSNDVKMNAECEDELMYIEGSVFNEYEAQTAIGWLTFTAVYWTLLTWIPILIKESFNANLSGFIIWCFGFIGMVSHGLALYGGEYPSGVSLKNKNKFEIHGIGRWTASILTSTIIIDCFILVYFSVDFDNINNFDNIIYDTNVCRLIFHVIHIFWASLFFITFAKSMAITTFILIWINIIWNCIISFTVTNPSSIDIIYFLIIGIQLICWMGPMMFNTKWGTDKYAQTVSIHLLLLDLFTNIPIIITILATQSYKYNMILVFDLIWKSFLVQRSVSLYFVKQVFLVVNKKQEYKTTNVDENVPGAESNEFYNINFKLITYIWLIFVFFYWSVCVFLRCVIDNEITLNYEYYIWFFGIIGVFSMFDSCFFNGYSANSVYGQSFISFTCLCITIDCIFHAYSLLAGEDNADDIIGVCVMVFHCVALISSIIFYFHAFKNNKGIGYSIGIQFVDIIVMFIVIEILHNYYQSISNGNCFSESLCNGYFAIFIIKIIFSFIPIIFNYVNDSKRINVHIVLLVTFTDLPLIFIIIMTSGYKVHPFVFIDIVFKVIILLISYSYHLINNILFTQCYPNQNDSN